MSNVDVHRRLHQLFNARQFDAFDEHMREDLSYEDMARDLTMKSLGDFKSWLGEWTTAFSDARVDEPDYRDGGTFTVARFRGRGTNDGPLNQLPATGRSMDTAFCELLTFDDTGKVISGAVYYDQLTLLVQLGHLEPPTQATGA